MKFSSANTKLRKLYQVESLQSWLTNNRKVYSFDLLSGWSCPFANECHAKVVHIDGARKVVDGPNTEFRCFSASQEALYTAVYNHRKANTDAIKACKTTAMMVRKIQGALPKDAGIVRIHVAGDFISEKYFVAWLIVAANNPNILFYAYTKSLPYWINNRKFVPENMVLTASRGGRRDDMIERYGLREAMVVYSEYEAGTKGLEIDNDDSHAADPTMRDWSFALLIHGTQPKGSKAAKALSQLKKASV